jgi:hypothetical protein
LASFTSSRRVCSYWADWMSRFLRDIMAMEACFMPRDCTEIGRYFSYDLAKGMEGSSRWRVSLSGT